MHRSLGRRLIKTAAFQRGASFVVSLIIRAVYASNRVEKHFPDAAKPYLTGELPAIFCFWHGRMILHPFIKPPRRGMYVLISNHNDGALITATMRWFGIGSVRGSRRKGGTAALRELFKVTAAQDNISITPDGPKGPHQQAAVGAAYVASKAGYPLIPVSFSASRHRRVLKSWDRFMIPRAFGRVAFVGGLPIIVAADSSEAGLQSATAELNAVLNHITAEADRLCGVAA